MEKKNLFITIFAISIIIIGTTSILLINYLDFSDPNQAPILASVSPTSNPIIEEGDSISFYIDVSDPDEDTLLYNWTSETIPIICDSDTYLFESNHSSAGIHIVNVSVSDGEFNVSHSWILTIIDIPHMLIDICPGWDSSYPVKLIIMDGVLYFFAYDGLNGRELWRTNGTIEGTYMVKDINPTGSSILSSDMDVIVFNNSLYFKADNGLNGSELWLSLIHI